MLTDTYRKFRVTYEPSMHVFDLYNETRVPEEIPCVHRADLQASCREASTALTKGNHKLIYLEKL